MGKVLDNMLSGLDFSSRDIDYRLKIVNDMLYKNGGLNNDLIDYLDNINVNISQQNKLNTYDRTVRTLEKIADYLLYAYKEKDKDIVYKFYSYTDLIKKAIAENKSIGMIINSLYFNYASKANKNELVYIKYNQNVVKLKKQVITKKDILNIPILKQYEKIKEQIRKELNSIDNLDIKNKKRKITLRSLYGEVVADQILAKDSYLGTIYFKNVNNVNIIDNDYVQINIYDKNNILEVLKCENNIMSSIGCIAYDVNMIVNSIKWNELETRIINLYKKDKKIIEIAYELGIEYHSVRYSLNKICKRIMKYYTSSYKDWTYKNKHI